MTVWIRIIGIGKVLAVNFEMRSRIISFHQPLKPFPSVPITFFLRTLHLQTLELHYVNLCLANRFWGRELKLAYTGGFEGSGTSPSGWPVCGAFAILRRAIYARSTRYLSSAYFSLIQDKKVSLTRNSFHSCAVYASYYPQFSIPEFLLWYLVLLDGFALHQPHFSCYTRTPGI